MQPRKGDDSSQNGFQNYAIDEYKMPVHIKPDRKRPNTIETAPPSYGLGAWATSQNHRPRFQKFLQILVK